jgi:tRNA (guanine-N7-)-methyltransferase
MNPESLALLRPAMAPGAELRVATDISGYAEHALEAVAASGGFLAETRAEPWPDWPGTRYEVKALRAGRRPHYLTFVRT